MSATYIYSNLTDDTSDIVSQYRVFEVVARELDLVNRLEMLLDGEADPQTVYQEAADQYAFAAEVEELEVGGMLQMSDEEGVKGTWVRTA